METKANIIIFDFFIQGGHLAFYFHFKVKRNSIAKQNNIICLWVGSVETKRDNQKFIELNN